MNIQKIHPFVRYAHYIPLEKNSKYTPTVPYDHRFFYMLDGSAAIMTDKKRYAMNKNDVLIVPSGNRYHLLPPEKSAVYIALNFDYTGSNSGHQKPIPPVDAESFDSRLVLESADTLPISGITHISEMKDFSPRLVRIEREYSQKLLHSDTVVSNILSELLLECDRAIQGEKYKSGNEITHLVVGYINENLEKPLSNKVIGAALKLHPNYISRLIKASTGLPLHRYLMQARICRSIELLSENKLTVSEIAERCGFCDIYHYSKSFKKIVGIPPSEYL